MIRTILATGLFFITTVSIAQQSNQHLRELLKERKDRFEEYTDAADKKSGIFGNRTRKDLQDENEVLIEIVRTDNHIMRELEATLSEKRSENYTVYRELNTREQDQQKLISAVDTLNKQVALLESKNSSLRTVSGVYKFLTWTLGIVLLFVLFRRKKSVDNSR